MPWSNGGCLEVCFTACQVYKVSVKSTEVFSLPHCLTKKFLLFLNVSRVHQSLNMTKTPNLLYTFVSSLKSICLNE